MHHKKEETADSQQNSQSADEKQLRNLIEEAVDTSVNQAFKRYGRKYSGGIVQRILRPVVSLLLIAALLCGGYYWMQSRHDVDPGELEDHDLTLENNGIFGYTAGDFEEVLLGESTRQKLLIVEEREASVNYTSTEAGFFNWGIFSKQQILTLHGTGEYTVDVSKIAADDISLNEETYEVTVRIPHAELHSTAFDPKKTEVGDTKKGWLAFGDIKMNAEQNKKFEQEAVSLLKEALSKKECLEEADRFAKLSAYEMYQPVVNSVSPAYKTVIEFKD